ncbi:MAG: DNA polymerase I [Planctomycetes bacterium]|nr:DNA polymerase I [Planctomycetota bacterium]
MPETLFLIDAYAHIHQVFYAIRGLTGPDGEPVNAVYGFARLLHKIEDDYNPDYLAVVFDPPGKVFRHEIYEEYKATRKPMPDPLQRQIPVIKEMLKKKNTPQLLVENYEADDVLGAAAARASEKGLESVLVTTDKDAEQLIDNNTKVLHIHKSREEMLDPEGLKEKRGVQPWQIVEMMALSGDTSDNIPGVYGIGPKTAVKLIEKFGTVENLYENLEEVSSDNIREKLDENRDQVELSRKLVTIDCSVPLDLDLKACAIEKQNGQELNEFYRALGFESFMDDNPSGSVSGQTTTRQGNLFETESEATDIAEPESIETTEIVYETIISDDKLDVLVRQLRENAPFSFDLETTSLEPHEAEIVGIALSWEEKKGSYVAVAGPPQEKLCTREKALAALQPLLEDPDIGIIGQNLKYDMLILKAYDIQLNGIVCDTMLASYLLQPAERSHSLDSLARRHLNYRPVPIKELIGKKQEHDRMDEVPVEKVAPYACEDADIAYRLSERLMPLLEKQELMHLFQKLELPLISVLADMEWHGIKIDQDCLEKMQEELETRVKSLEQKIFEKAGREFNVNSPKQLSTVLFDEMELPPPKGKKRTTGYSTASDVLTALAQDHEVAEYLLEYRELNKLKSTYADALLKIVNPKTGRLHTSFNQSATATGRLSSSDPNLQNIPVRTELGRRIRRAFVPADSSMSLLGADYSQVELRVLAHCSEDETLRKAFREDRDIHSFVAAQINDISEKTVTKEMRQKAKAVNFGIVYGQSAYGLSKSIGVPVPEAQKFIDSYFERYPRVKTFIGKTVSQARENGYVRTLAGRRRAIKGIRSSGQVRSAAERIAVNSVIQGSAADLIKLAMISIYKALPQISQQSRMLVQIHDELLFEVPDPELDAVRHFVVKK